MPYDFAFNDTIHLVSGSPEQSVEVMHRATIYQRMLNFVCINGVSRCSIGLCRLWLSHSSIDGDDVFLASAWGIPAGLIVVAGLSMTSTT